MKYLLFSLTCFLFVTSGYSKAPAPAGIVNKVPLEFSSNCLILRVKIKDVAHAFLVDTGSNHSVIDSTLLSPPVDATNDEILTNGGKIVAVPFAKIGPGITDKNIENYGPIGIMDLSAIRILTGEDIYGIVGMDFIKHFTLVVRPTDNQYYLLPSLKITQNSSKFKKSKLTWKNGLPYIQLTALQQKIPFMIDTGFDGSLEVAKVHFDELAKFTDPTQAGMIAMGSISGVRSAPIFLTDSFELRGTRPKGLGVSASLDSRNILGLKFLCRYNVIMNFPKSEIFYLPNNRINDVDIINRSGIGIIKDGGRIVVSVIHPNTLASSMDIKVGDLIYKVNGTEVKNTSLTDLRNEIAPLAAWDRMELILEREGKFIRIQVSKRKE